MKKNSKTYSELMAIDSYKERYEYLKTNSKVGVDTFGYDRVFNQMLYHNSDEWKVARRKAIIRDSIGDDCFDMGHPDVPINGPIIVHHINPITMDDIREGSPKLFDLENLICCSDRTHRAIHYGSFELIDNTIHERTPNDTCPWKRGDTT